MLKPLIYAWLKPFIYARIDNFAFNIPIFSAMHKN